MSIKVAKNPQESVETCKTTTSRAIFKIMQFYTWKLHLKVKLNKNILYIIVVSRTKTRDKIITY